MIDYGTVLKVVTPYSAMTIPKHIRSAWYWRCKRKNYSREKAEKILYRWARATSYQAWMARIV